ncbi:MAG TPA: acetamidase/formamidase family protein [Geobacterales bacterium]|nr:acetamidase/formamidase family protein [Geobacterales bacterium]
MVEKYTLHAITHNVWDNSLEPVLKIRSGDEVELESKEASNGQLNPASTASDITKLDFSKVNPLTGPIEIEDARPGDMIEIEYLDFKHEGWGWTAVIPGFGLLANDQGNVPNDLSGPALKIWKVKDSIAKTKFGDLDVEVPIRPFTGEVGTAPLYKGKWSTIPPRENGGNLDIKYLGVGAKVYLPVFVKGGLLSMGDTHLAQGDGEVCGTAIEAPMKVHVRVKLLRNVGLSKPLFKASNLKETTFKEYIAYPGISSNLWDATKEATKGIINILSNFMSPIEAYMLASVAMDLKISEVVDAPNWVVSAFFPLDIIADESARAKLRNYPVM